MEGWGYSPGAAMIIKNAVITGWCLSGFVLVLVVAWEVHRLTSWFIAAPR